MSRPLIQVVVGFCLLIVVQGAAWLTGDQTIVVGAAAFVGGGFIAVGVTVLRRLETVAAEQGAHVRGLRSHTWGRLVFPVQWPAGSKWFPAVTAVIAIAVGVAWLVEGLWQV